jgi:hypothetical protein
VTDPRPRPAFAHASEAELARILDFYEVAWAYEPHTYPILFDRDGAVLESFSPDFYLPELDLYVEITTLRQRLVRKKNRKLRRLRELYPEIRVKLLYARDFRALLLKYGRIALADALSGTEGQSTPPRKSAAGTARHAASGPGRPDGHEAPPTAARTRRARRSRAEARARVAAAASAGAGTLTAAAGTAAGTGTTAATTGTEMRA